MSPEPEKPERTTTRRNVLALAVGAGTVAAGSLLTHAVTSEPTPAPEPSPSASPREPLLAPRDRRLVTSLRRGSPTPGVKARWAGAFPSTKVKDAVLLHGMGEGTFPWLAATIVGPENQLQIIDPDSRKLLHSLNAPKSHNGGIQSMAWARDKQVLYLCTRNYLYAWTAATPRKMELLGQVPDATTLYDLQLDSEGNLWGGTYPSGTVFRYTPDGNQIKTFPRFAADTDYVRSLAIDANGQVWAGTGSLNPRIFSFTTKAPEQRREIQLPEPMANGFISRLAVHGQHLAVSASNVSEQLLLDTRSLRWDGALDRVWAARRTSDSARSGDTFYTLTKGELYATNTTTWTETKLGSVQAASPLLISAAGESILVASAAPTGIRLEYFSRPQGQVHAEGLIPLASGKFTVQSLLGHSDGNVYVGGYMGRGLAAIDPDTGRRWRSPDGQDVINQIEGMIEFDAQRLYVGSYGSADIVGVDFTRRDNPEAYERLVRLSTEYQQSRPFGWAKNSRDVFFGTVPDYGKAGGVVGMIDPATNTVEWVLDGQGKGFIEAQSIIGLAADEEHLYGVSSVRNGYGIPDTQGLAQVFKLEIASRKLLWQSEPIKNAGALYAPTLIAQWLVVADIEGIAVIDPDSGKLVKRHRLTDVAYEERRPGWANADIARIGEGTRLVHSAHGIATVVDFVEGTIARLGNPKDQVSFGARLAVGPTGRVFGSMDQTTVVEFDLGTAKVEQSPGASTSPRPSLTPAG